MVWKREQRATPGLQEVQGHWECRALEEGRDGCVLACADQTQCCQQEFLWKGRRPPAHSALGMAECGSLWLFPCNTLCGNSISFSRGRRIPSSNLQSEDLDFGYSRTKIFDKIIGLSEGQMRSSPVINIDWKAA